MHLLCTGLAATEVIGAGVGKGGTKRAAAAARSCSTDTPQSIKKTRLEDGAGEWCEMEHPEATCDKETSMEQGAGDSCVLESVAEPVNSDNVQECPYCALRVPDLDAHCSEVHQVFSNTSKCTLLHHIIFFK